MLFYSQEKCEAKLLFTNKEIGYLLSFKQNSNLCNLPAFSIIFFIYTKIKTQTLKKQEPKKQIKVKH